MSFLKGENVGTKLVDLPKKKEKKIIPLLKNQNPFEFKGKNVGTKLVDLPKKKEKKIILLLKNQNPFEFKR